MRDHRPRNARKTADLQGFTTLHTALHRCGKKSRRVAIARATRAVQRFRPGARLQPPVENIVREGFVYTARSPRRAARTIRRRCLLPETPRETHLSAQRSTPETQARLSRAHVDPRRPRDPQAPARQGPEAALRLTGASTPCSAGTACPVRGTSTPSTGRAARSRNRYLTLHWFPRDDRRRAAARSRGAEGGRERRRAEPREAPAARDLARARRRSRAAATTCWSRGRGSPSRRDARGAAWLAEQVADVLGKARRVSHREIRRRRRSSTRGAGRSAC